MDIYAVNGFVPEIIHKNAQETVLRLYYGRNALGAIFVPNECLSDIMYLFVKGAVFLGEYNNNEFHSVLPENTLRSEVNEAIMFIGIGDELTTTYTLEEIQKIIKLVVERPPTTAPTIDAAFDITAENIRIPTRGTRTILYGVDNANSN